MSNQPEITLATIKPGREGWVYLVHAEGTNRYKIGRSVNPVARHQVLQGQSPYPLKIIRTFWTVDAVTDEAYLHEVAAEHRAYGEWFELQGSGINNSYFKVDDAFSFGYVMDSLAHTAINHFFRQIGLSQKEAEESFLPFLALVAELYYQLTDRAALLLLERFMYQQLPEIAASVSEELTKEKTYYFLLGTLKGFAAAQGRILR